MTREVVEHLDLARLRLAHYRGQLGEAIYRLQGPILVPDLLAQGGGGIGADEGWRLYLDPVEVLRWTIAQVATALEHEVWHGILDHAGRARVRGIGPVEAGLWNICADFEINTMMGRGASWPYPVLFPEDYGLLPGLTAEQYFNEIKRQRVQPPSFGFQFAPACGDGQGGSDDASGGGGEQGDGAQGKAGGGEQGDGEQGKAGSGGGKPGDGEQGKAGGGGGKQGDAQGKAGGGGGQGRGSISDGLRRPWE